MPSSNRISSSSFPSSSSSSSLTPLSRHLCLAALLTLSLTPLLISATPFLSRRQTVTDGAEICDITGPDMVEFDKSEGPKTFVLRKTGDCEVGFFDIYQIVSYSPEEYQLFR